MVWEIISPPLFVQSQILGTLPKGNFMTSCKVEMRATSTQIHFANLGNIETSLHRWPISARLFSSFPFLLPCPWQVPSLGWKDTMKAKINFCILSKTASFGLCINVCDLKCPSVSLGLLAFSIPYSLCQHWEESRQFSFLEFCIWKLPYMRSLKSQRQAWLGGKTLCLGLWRSLGWTGF